MYELGLRQLLGFIIHIWKLESTVPLNVSTDNNSKLTREFRKSELLSRSVLFPMHLLPWIELADCFDLGFSSARCSASRHLHHFMAVKAIKTQALTPEKLLTQEFLLSRYVLCKC